MKSSSFRQIVLCLIIIFLTGCAPIPPASIKAHPTSIEVTSFPTTLKLDEINMEFSGYEFDSHSQSFLITICFDPPSDRTWFFGDISLKVENQEFAVDGISRDPNPGRADGFECQMLIYYTNHAIVPSGKAELTIRRLGLFVNIEERDCKTAQQHLDEAKTGVIVTCHPTIAGAFTVTKKPASMSSEEAVLIADDAFSYSEAIPLQWRFSFLVEKP